MKFTVEIECDNAAFDEDLTAELHAVLDRVKASFSRTYGREPGYDIDGPTRDTNGNTVGFWKLEQ